MGDSISEAISVMLAAEKSRTLKQGLLAVAGVFVALLTIYTLILPGITMANQAFCGFEEHAHSDKCNELVLVCDIEEGDGCSGHVHSDLCYTLEKVLVCGLEEGTAEGVAVDDVESDDADEASLSSDFASESDFSIDSVSEHTHLDSCYAEHRVLACGLEEGAGAEAGHAHSDSCYESVLACDLPEHEHTAACYSDSSADVETASVWEATLPGNDELTGDWAADVLAVADSQLGYKESSANFAVTDSGATKGYTRYGAWYGDAYGDWCAMFVSFCLHYAGVDEALLPLDANCQNWIKTLSSADYGLWRPVIGGVSVVPCEGAAAGEGDSSVDDEFTPYEPKPGDLIFFNWDSEADSDHVGLVYEIIEATENEPAKVKTIEGNSADMVRYEEYELHDASIMGYADLPENPAPQLTDEEQARVDKVIELINALPDSSEIEEVLLSFEEAEDWDAYEEYMADAYASGLTAYAHYRDLGSRLQSLVTNSDKLFELEWLWSVSMMSITDSVTICQVNAYSQAVPTIVSGSSVDATLDSTLGNFIYWSAVVVERDESGVLRVARYIDHTEHVAKRDLEATSDGGFVLIVYDSSIDARVGDVVSVDFDYSGTLAYKAAGHGSVSFGLPKADKDNSDKLTIVPSADTSDLIEVNLYDYGDNINDLYNSNDKYPGFQQDEGTESASYLNFGNNITEDLAAGHSNVTVADATGNINATVATYNGVDYGRVNIPISGVMKSTLVNGYPEIDGDNINLSYLFSDNTYAEKQNESSINGLFQYDEVTGAYTFNSRDNHAQFDADTDTFTLYEQVITSNFMMYPFGNFLPLNDIVHESMQSSEIDRDYLASIADSAEAKYNSGADVAYQTLSTVLNAFVDLMDSEQSSEDWGAADAVNKYFTSSNIPMEFEDDDPLLQRVYTIDYDEPTNFYFGMDMKMTFMQPKDGMTGNDTNGDGHSDYPMVFYFTGDDDVWVYVDGVLFLDLSGIHRHVGGEIDFEEGVVRYYALDVPTGDVSTTPYKTVTFAEILGSTEGLNEAGTFEDYTTHTFNFYYMERGAGSGVCRMNFNFPLLKQNAISVSKDVESDGELLGNPDYKFQVLQATESGAKTNDLFIGANTEYAIYDLKTNAVLGTGTTDANGVFTLKAGQRAEFDGIEEDAGKYYVRELLEDAVLEQYEGITVSGESTTTSYDVTVGDDDFAGLDSPVKDMSDGTTAFRFVNHVDVKKFGALSVTKQLAGNGAASSNKTYDIQVSLDGKLLPVGTAYVVGDEQRVVGEAGIITLAADETAVISNILAGTTFEVKETSDSAKGYFVAYSESSGDSVEVKDNAVTGVVNANANVQLVVTNSEKGATVSIPGTKSLTKYDGIAHSFEFRLDEVTDETGALLKEGGLSSYVATTEVVDEPGAFNFEITYALPELEGAEGVFYYRITEDPSDVALANSTVYVVEVTVEETDTESGATATVTRMWKGVMSEGGSPENMVEVSSDFLSADFANTLAGNLSLSKTVVGAETDHGFSFTIAFDSSSLGVDLPSSFSAVVYKEDGAVEDVELVLNEDGEITLDDFKDGERIVISDIPYGITWIVTETGADGYEASYEVKAGGTTSFVAGAVASGTVNAGNNEVACINTQMYELPETGGIGTFGHTLVGLALIGAALFGIWQFRRRREGIETF